MLKPLRDLSRKVADPLCRFADISASDAPTALRSNYREAMIYRGANPGSQLGIAEGAFLGELVRQSDPERPIVEIGTLYGLSALVISLFKPREQQFITVDNYSWNSLGVSREAQKAIVQKRLEEAVRERNVTVLDSDKDRFYESYEGPPPALFFCDANHSYEATRRDLEWARQVGATIICGDDYDQTACPGVVRAVEAMGGAETVVGRMFVLNPSAAA